MAASQYDSTTSQLFTNASLALSNAISAAASIGTSTKPTLLNPSLSFSVPDKDFGSGPVFSDLFDGADSTNADIAALNDNVDAWLAKYFPAINGNFNNVPEDYLVGVIGGTKPFGIDKSIFDLVWQQSRDRVYRTTQTEQRQLEASFSSRGFSIPPGALIDQIAASERRATDATLDSLRDAAIKEADIKVDLLKHAVGIAAQLKQGILATSAEFFRNYYSVYQLSNETARVRAQAYDAYYQALQSFYNVEVSWEGLRLRAAETTAQVGVDTDRNRLSLFDAANNVSGAYSQAVQGFTNAAGSAYNAAGSLTVQTQTVS